MSGLPAIGQKQVAYGEDTPAEDGDAGGEMWEMKRNMDRLASRLDSQQSKIDALSKALVAEESARVKLQSIVDQRNGPAAGGDASNAEVADLQAKLNHLYRMLKEKEAGGSKEEKTGGDNNNNKTSHKIANLIRDFEVLHSSSASIMSLVGALQSHLAEERTHRMSGQQEIREVVSAEITARRKNQTKVQTMLERCTARQDEDAANFRRESLLLADHLDGRIRTVEASITSLATSLYQELRDIREFARDAVTKNREEINIIRSFAEATSTAGLASEIETRMTEQFEHLVNHTNIQVGQLEDKSKQSFLGLLSTVSGLNAEATQLRQELGKEAQQRVHADKLLQNMINGLSSSREVFSAVVAGSGGAGAGAVVGAEGFKSHAFALGSSVSEPAEPAATEDDLPSADDPEANAAAIKLQARMRGAAARKQSTNSTEKETHVLGAGRDGKHAEENLKAKKAELDAKHAAATAAAAAAATTSHSPKSPKTTEL